MTGNNNAARVSGKRGGGRRRLVAIVVGLEGTVLRKVEVRGLLVGEDG